MTTKWRAFDDTAYTVDLSSTFETSVAIHVGGHEHEHLLQANEVVTRLGSRHWQVTVQGGVPTAEGPPDDETVPVVVASVDGTPWTAGFPGVPGPVWTDDGAVHQTWSRVTDGSRYRRYHLGATDDLLHDYTADSFID